MPSVERTPLPEYTQTADLNVVDQKLSGDKALRPMGLLRRAPDVEVQYWNTTARPRMVNGIAV